ncbi:hypothetical protein IAU60_006941 [Kwoniella sp. DSM 27419]
MALRGMIIDAPNLDADGLQRMREIDPDLAVLQADERDLCPKTAWDILQQWVPPQLTAVEQAIACPGNHRSHLPRPTVTDLTREIAARFNDIDGLDRIRVLYNSNLLRELASKLSKVTNRIAHEPDDAIMQDFVFNAKLVNHVVRDVAAFEELFYESDASTVVRAGPLHLANKWLGKDALWTAPAGARGMWCWTQPTAAIHAADYGSYSLRDIRHVRRSSRHPRDSNRSTVTTLSGSNSEARLPEASSQSPGDSLFVPTTANASTSATIENATASPLQALVELKRFNAVKDMYLQAMVLMASDNRFFEIVRNENPDQDFAFHLEVPNIAHANLNTYLRNLLTRAQSALTHEIDPSYSPDAETLTVDDFQKVVICIIVQSFAEVHTAKCDKQIMHNFKSTFVLFKDEEPANKNYLYLSDLVPEEGLKVGFTDVFGHPNTSQVTFLFLLVAIAGVSVTAHELIHSERYQVAGAKRAAEDADYTPYYDLKPKRSRQGSTQSGETTTPGETSQLPLTSRSITINSENAAEQPFPPHPKLPAHAIESIPFLEPGQRKLAPMPGSVRPDSASKSADFDQRSRTRLWPDPDISQRLSAAHTKSMVLPLPRFGFNLDLSTLKSQRVDHCGALILPPFPLYYYCEEPGRVAHRTGAHLVVKTHLGSGHLFDVFGGTITFQADRGDGADQLEPINDRPRSSLAAYGNVDNQSSPPRPRTVSLYIRLPQTTRRPLGFTDLVNTPDNTDSSASTGSGSVPNSAVESVFSIVTDWHNVAVKICSVDSFRPAPLFDWLPATDDVYDSTEAEDAVLRVAKMYRLLEVLWPEAPVPKYYGLWRSRFGPKGDLVYVMLEERTGDAIAETWSEVPDRWKSEIHGTISRLHQRGISLGELEIRHFRHSWNHPGQLVVIDLDQARRGDRERCEEEMKKLNRLLYG